MDGEGYTGKAFEPDPSVRPGSRIPPDPADDPRESFLADSSRAKSSGQVLMGQLEEPSLRKRYEKETLLAKVKEHEEVSAQLNQINYHLREATFKVEEDVKRAKQAEKIKLENKRDRIFRER